MTRVQPSDIVRVGERGPFVVTSVEADLATLRTPRGSEHVGVATLVHVGVHLGPCDNSAEGLTYGGLIPKGPQCAGSRATHIAVYDEINGNTRDTMKLCEVCLAQVRTNVRAARRLALSLLRHLEFDAKGKRIPGAFEWGRKLTVLPPEKVSVEHVRAWVRSYKRVPRALGARFNIGV